MTCPFQMECLDLPPDRVALAAVALAERACDSRDNRCEA
jgi:hypothetical protein